MKVQDPRPDQTKGAAKLSEAPSRLSRSNTAQLHLTSRRGGLQRLRFLWCSSLRVVLPTSSSRPDVPGPGHRRSLRPIVPYGADWQSLLAIDPRSRSTDNARANRGIFGSGALQNERSYYRGKAR